MDPRLCPADCFSRKKGRAQSNVRGGDGNFMQNEVCLPRERRLDLGCNSCCGWVDGPQILAGAGKRNDGSATSFSQIQLKKKKKNSFHGKGVDILCTWLCMHSKYIYIGLCASKAAIIGKMWFLYRDKKRIGARHLFLDGMAYRRAWGGGCFEIANRHALRRGSTRESSVAHSP